MSGAFGWARANSADAGTRVHGPDNFAGAKGAYGGGAKRVDIGFDSNDGRSRKIDAFANKLGPKTIPNGKSTLSSTAANVVMVVLDVTGSMQEWPQEIFRRLPLLYTDLVRYLGSDDLEVLFIAHGDASGSDRYPVQVGRFARGAELDAVLASLEREGGGSGRESQRESQELIAYYMVERIDTTSAQNVFVFFVTDEAGYDTVTASQVDQLLGVPMNHELIRTADVFAKLSITADVYAVVCDTKSYDSPLAPTWWKKMLGSEQVLLLDDARRIVDVLLGVMAGKVGKDHEFDQDLTRRQVGMPHGYANIANVHKTLAIVRRGGKTRLLLPPDVSGSHSKKTRSLLDD
ncbi:MAG: hypothetical protein KBC83_01695 [Candidatus Moranbacteria bacterium]|jgi:hypothetical protein|nr:hypothetical protein [Candidatus Moranbacteria bacterium]MBP9801362.1 hypothetical protein [Candidatus Moranbacteria bacterium]